MTSTSPNATSTGNGHPDGAPGESVIETDIPARLDRLPWSRWHWMVLIGLGTVWVLDGLEVTIVGSVGGTLTKAGSGIAITTAQVGDAAGIYVAGACLGALVFGHLTDRLGRKRLFMVTLGVYLIATVLTAFSRNAAMFFVLRFLTGMGIGGEYAAINSAIDELIPARVRGTVDLAVNGSYWFGTAVGAAATLVLLDPTLLPIDLGWRLCFGIGAVLGLAILLVRRQLPESPRWQMTHGHLDDAERGVDDIEEQVARSSDSTLDDVSDDTVEVHDRDSLGIIGVARVVFGHYPRRSVLGLSLFVGQAFLYNAVFFTYALVLTTFYHVPANAIGLYLIAFAVGNLLGPVLLGHLFDVIGRRVMISTCYLTSGILLGVTAWLFDAGRLDATTQTVAWVVVFFFASAGASAAYLTVSEVFPMETRALAIALFYAIGTGLGGIIGPVLFGHLIATKRPSDTALGYVIGAALMCGAGLVEVVLGVDAEQKSLEDLATPLTATADGAGDETSSPAGAGTPTGVATPPRERVLGPSPLPATRLGRFGWAPLPQASRYPRNNPYLVGEVDRIVSVLDRGGVLTTAQLADAVGSRHWGPGRLRDALRSGLASGRIRRVGRDRYAAARDLGSPSPNGDAAEHDLTGKH